MRVEAAEINTKLKAVRFIVAVDTTEEERALQGYAERAGLTYHRNLSSCTGLYRYYKTESEGRMTYELLKDFVVNFLVGDGWEPL
jgi:hypothetical protein